MNEDSLSFLLGTAEMEISNLHKEIEALNAQRKYDEALQKIGRMEQLTDPKDRVMQQFLLRSKAWRATCRMGSGLLMTTWQSGKCCFRQSS